MLRKEVQNIVVILAGDVIKMYKDQQNGDIFQQMIMSHIDGSDEKKKLK